MRHKYPIVDAKNSLDMIIWNFYYLYNIYIQVERLGYGEEETIDEYEFIETLFFDGSLIKISPCVLSQQLHVQLEAKSIYEFALYNLMMWTITRDNNRDFKNIGFCQYCNSYFFRTTTKQIYCSTSHKNMANKSNGNHLQKNKHCELCGNLFEAEHQKAKYCKNCNPKKAYYQKKKEVSP